MIKLRDATTFEIIDLLRSHFDHAHYLLRNPDVERAGIDPLEHFVFFGWKENRNPHPEFSTLGYLTCNPDVAASGVNPFWHYHVAGKSEGRVWTLPDASFDEKAASPKTKSLDDRTVQEIAALRAAFDADFYLRSNQDVAKAGIDPVEHFVVFGWKENRDPTPEFSTLGYLTRNPDVAAAGVNPFWHYHTAGKSEGRMSRHPGGYRAEALMNTLPLEETVKVYWQRIQPEAVLTSAELCDRVRGWANGKSSTLMLSVGQDNYRSNAGGLQYCIQHEEKAAGDRWIVYLNLHPHQPLPRLAHRSETPDVLVSLLLSGTMIGTAPMSTVIEAVSSLSDDFDEIEVVVHHLMGHSPEQIADMVRATNRNSCRLWLHDFFTLCPSHALQRNNLTACAAPALTSNACRLCLYGEERVDHLERLSLFFKELSVHLIAPSHFAAEMWKQRSNLEAASLTVCEHMAITWSKQQKNTLVANGPVTVAFVGNPAPHKGWHMFERIVLDNNSHDIRHRFVYFGTSQIGLDNVEVFPVQVTAEDPDAMIRALTEQQVDIVLHWASAPETFSFSTQEALAAGAYVLTSHISGNVAVTVRRSGLGAVFDAETDLRAYFRDGRIHAQTTDIRARRRTLRAVSTRSDMTLSVLDRERST